jgi:hypothetical protein
MRYLDMPVPSVKDDKVTGWQSVSLNKYVLIVGHDDNGGVTWDKDHPNNQAAHDALLGKLRQHFAKAGATLVIHVKEAGGGVSHEEFDNWRDLWYYARKSFFGKGSPEEAQITLQLADRFGLLPAGGLQKYCDTYLGLDCNGFVGNYLIHGKAGKDWEAEPPGSDFLANQGIATIVKRNGSQVNTVDELVATNSYLMALAASNGSVINQYADGSFGHILITVPGLKYESVYADDKKGKKVWTMWATESTGGVGLITAACQILDVSADGIFTVKRFSHPLMAGLRFRVFRVL